MNPNCTTGICVFTMYGDNYSGIASVTVPNMEKYCKRHGYDFKVLLLDGDGNDYAYKKHEYIKELFKRDIDIVWYLDCDAMVTNHKIRLEDFLDEDYSVFLTRDFTELNGGSIIIRNNELGRWFNDYILSRRGHYQNEQNVINANEFSFKHFMKHLPHPSINSYRYDLYLECASHVGKPELGDWKPGNFVLHVPGLGVERRKEILSQAKITE